MLLNPQTIEELSTQLAEASAANTKLDAVDVSGLQSLVQYAPEDMTATVQAGMTLQAFQQTLARHGQWLPLQPAGTPALNLADVLAQNLSGPRRFGYGTIRDYLIGIKVALADGEIIKAGGNVVKNVAGYDLCKLFIGAKHTLGIIVEATFKLRPIPETEIIVQRHFDSVDQLNHAASEILRAGIQPVILDAHNIGEPLTLVTGFAGSREDTEHQIAIVRALGISADGSLDFDHRFWNEPKHSAKISILPSETARVLARINGAEFVARLGNGIVYYRGSDYAEPPKMNDALMNRVKAAFDPRHIFPEYIP